VLTLLARVARPPKLTANGVVPQLLTDFRPRVLTTDVAFQGGDMPRVVVVCTDNASCEGLRQASSATANFKLSAE
jgi:hypothetical protein